MKVQKNIIKLVAAYSFSGVFLFGCSRYFPAERVQESSAQAVVHFDWRFSGMARQTNNIWSVDIYSDGRIEYSNSFPEQHKTKQKIDQDMVIRMLSEIRHAGFLNVTQRELDAYIEKAGISTNDASTTTLRIVWCGKPHTVCYEAIVVLYPSVEDMKEKHIKALNKTIDIVHAYTGLQFR